MIPLKDDNPSSVTPFVTIAFIAINVLVFYFEVTIGFEKVISKYALFPSDIVQGKNLETLITSMFLHGGFLHLGGNMLYLWIFGDNVESYLGHFRFIYFYLICGLCAVAFHIFLGGVSQVPMVGASGAISGILGAYLMKYPKANVLVIIPIFYFITIRRIPALIVLGLWFVMQLFSGFATIGYKGGGVAFWAHVGGFVAGLLLIHLFPPKRRPTGISFE
ncbi:rhomboid family intramembrane serine protease [candidate division KSB1 bacterium]|nr:rhomboid family intramembrane serine protease [candidate division KSB1 bacterium]